MHTNTHRRIQIGLWLALALILGGLQPAPATLMAAVPAPAAQHQVLTVNSTDDPGEAECAVASCTLRAAILAANANPGSDTIEFNIPGDGPHTITVQSRLPAITQPLHIDGTTQPGYDGLPLIELDGGQALDSGHGLDFTGAADHSRVEGLAITGFRLEGIQLLLVDYVRISNNYIGVGADGETPRGNRGSGIVIRSGSFNSINDNVISANDLNGLVVEGSEARDNTISRNFIGTNPTGLDLGNGRDGILARNSGPQIIGGTYLPMSGCCEGNTIAFNAANGVAVTAGFNASYEKGILGNRIYANSGLGIDLQRDGVTENDPDDSDGDGLGNRLQNFPVLDIANVSNAATPTVTITGTLTTRADASFRIEFFANDACDPSGHGQGQRYLGGEYYTSDENGVVAFTAVFEEPFDPASASDFIAATATDADGNTSEFSACLQAAGNGDSNGDPTDSVIYLPMIGH